MCLYAILPQFRLLLVLSGLGRAPSSRLATELGMTASSVTRLADRMEAIGLIARGADPLVRASGRRGGAQRAAAGALDVVAGDRRPSHRPRRTGRATRPRRRL
jgi:hypothetical protein